MEAIMLSIKPEFAYKIISGEKQFEFRRRLCKKDICKIYIYATAPIQKVIAEVEVTGKILDSKEAVWAKTCSFSGISKEYFDVYFKGMERAGAYCLGRAAKYSYGKTLHEFGIKSAPQSFSYITI